MQNVVTAIFDAESEGFQTLAELRQRPFTAEYTVAEAALIKLEKDQIVLLDGFDTGVTSTDDSAIGMLVGSVAGILGGPAGVLLGAGAGAAVGMMFDSADFFGDSSLLLMVANKLEEDDVAIVCLVDEDEPAFDAALNKYNPIIIRRDVASVARDVELAVELETELRNEENARLKAERKAEIKANIDQRMDEHDARREETLKAIDDHFDEIDDRREEFLENIKQGAADFKEEAYARFNEDGAKMDAAMERRGREIREFLDGDDDDAEDHDD